MNTVAPPHHCQAEYPCEHPARFEARLEARGTTRPIHKTAELCAEHLGDVVHELTIWAHGAGLTDGLVTVSIIDTEPGRLISPAAEHGPYTSGLTFGTIALGE